ncbi:MAG: HD domain-containing protein [Candidatus Saccharimonadales bacterium]
MPKTDPLFNSLQQMIIDLSLINRNHYLANTERRENDIEHSMTVAVLCWYIHDKYKIDLNIGSILKYAITHDFVERYAGDVNTFASAEERNAKIYREQQSLNRLSEEFSGFNDMVSSMQKYELKQDDESLFVWTVDKMQGLIMGDMDSWRPYAEIDINYEKFVVKYGELLEKSSSYCREIFEGLIEHSKTTYYDQPKV